MAESSELLHVRRTGECMDGSGGFVTTFCACGAGWERGRPTGRNDIIGLFHADPRCLWENVETRVAVLPGAATKEEYRQHDEHQDA